MRRWGGFEKTWESGNHDQTTLCEKIFSRIIKILKNKKNKTKFLVYDKHIDLHVPNHPGKPQSSQYLHLYK